MTFQQTLKVHYPMAMTESDFIRKTYQTLNQYGFDADNTIACVGVCRDELTRTLIDEVQRVWGEAFNFSSLAGMLFLGKTGFLAAAYHSPQLEGRERYVYLTMPHIAIGRDGEIGQCYRPGRVAMSNACGALMAFQQELNSGYLNLDIDPNDIEQSLLKQRLFRKIKYGHVPDLVTLTRQAYEVIFEDLEHMLSLTVDTGQNDYAVLSGIQIHGPDKENYIWPGALYAMVEGQKKELAL